MDEEKEERRISEKQIKLIVFVVIVVAVIGIALWGMVPGKTYEVSEILDTPGQYNGLEVSVKGEVAEWNLSHNFTITDSMDTNRLIHVNHDGALPEGFGNGETIIVTGIFNNTVSPTIQSQSIQIGCPSKY